jgi:hypothetical protein
LDSALVEGLATIERGATVDEALVGHEEFADELRSLLLTAQEVRTLGRDAPEAPALAAQRGRARMQAARLAQLERRGRNWGWIPWRAVGLGSAAAALAAVLVVAEVGPFSPDTAPVQAQGTISRTTADAIVINTREGQVEARIVDDTVVLDGSGNVIGAAEIVPGSRATVELEEGEDGLSGLKIEIEDEDGEAAHGAEVEFGGTVLSVQGSTLTLQTSFGSAVVIVDSSTEINGSLAPGLTLEVHGSLQPDGTYLAREIEVQGANDGQPDFGDNGEAERQQTESDDSESGSETEDTDHAEDPPDQEEESHN